MINQIKLPSAQLLNAENNKPLSTTVKYLCMDTGNELYPKDIGTYLPLGEQKVEFTKEEMNQIKSFGEPSLVLIGFKPKDRLKIFHNIKAPYFLYPDDERVENSSKFFDGLIETMVAKKKIAIARFIPKNKSKVRFVALVPQKESYDEEEDTHTPGGLNVIFLPYADEIRDTRSIEETASMENELTEPNKQQILNAKKLINGLTVNFSPHNFENTNLQTMYSYLQALALGESEPEPVADTLKPDAEGMEAMEPLVLRFRESIWGQDYIDPEIRIQQEEEAQKKGRGLGKAKKQDAADDQPAPVKKNKKQIVESEEVAEKPSVKKSASRAKAAKKIEEEPVETQVTPKKTRQRKPKEPVETFDEEVQPSVTRSQKASQNKSNAMDIEKPKPKHLTEKDDDDDSEEDVLRKKAKGKSFTKR